MMYVELDVGAAAGRCGIRRRYGRQFPSNHFWIEERACLFNEVHPDDLGVVDGRGQMRSAHGFVDDALGALLAGLGGHHRESDIEHFAGGRG